MKSIGRSKKAINPEPFVQVWERLIHAEISDGALRTYMVLREHAWSVGSVYRDGYDQLAKARGIKPRALSNHIDELVAVGAITKEQVGKRRENRLTIMPFSNIDPSGDQHGSAIHIEGDRHGSAIHIAPVTGTSVHGDRHGSADMTGTDVQVYSYPDTHSSPDISTDASDVLTSANASHGPAGGVLEEGLSAFQGSSASPRPWLRLDGEGFEIALDDEVALGLITEAIQTLGREDWSAEQIVAVLVAETPVIQDSQVALARAALGVARSRVMELV